ncbi:TauD/TfdA family dioxygenase [Nonomuraea sp. NPDC050556]|uniref:TauD/TfdA family dioxygenase n=1 Tax=Nonomuraea sp. NPDC050556 TaxID=3364369 RepID=UPI0037B8661D
MHGAQSRGGWQRGPVDDLLHRHGAVLFRGFELADLAQFDEATAALIREPGTFLEESSSRTRLTDISFTSTDYPARYGIQFHSEYSYSDTWPARLVFGCLVPPGSGGTTLLSDTRRVLRRLPEERLPEFVRLGIRYQRNITNLGVAWSVAFGTENPDEVERACNARGIQWRWSPAGLHTTQYADAVVRHPAAGELCWFNHALIFNVHGLEPESLREALLDVGADMRSSDTSLGDGTTLDAETVDLIRQAYAAEAAAVEWRRGDVLVIDNMITAHARAPYRGDRRIVVSMGDPVHRRSLRAVSG